MYNKNSKEEKRENMIKLWAYMMVASPNNGL